VVGPGQEAEEVVGVVGPDGVAGRVLAVEQGGHGALGERADRRGVAIPRGVVGEPGQVGVADGVDPAVGIEQRLRRQLVEDEHQHRGRPAAGTDARELGVGGDLVRGPDPVGDG